MSEYLEIAYAAAARRLCLFTGTGFSKAVTDHAAPSWQQLLEELCDAHCDGSDLKSTLFPKEGDRPLQMEEAAQVIELQLTAKNIVARDEIAASVSKLELKGDLQFTREFFSTRHYRVITTNYDKLVEELAGEDCQTLCSGLPVPRSNSRVKVFHVHGSVDFPPRMVVTSDDYFEFMNSEAYFARKMSTVLHENTVVILGYSLGDTNLKAILSDYSGFWRNHSVGSSISFVSRSKVPQPIADYYAACFGIRVIDETEVEEFFAKVEGKFDAAVHALEQSQEHLADVLNGEKVFSDTFLKQHDSFFQIIAAIGAAGKSLNSTEVVGLFGKIIDQKLKFTAETGEWSQYLHLASWLSHLGSLIEIKSRSIEGKYLEAVEYSMNSMSQAQRLGYSWHAFRKWDVKWRTILSSNRKLIRDHIRENNTNDDALKIVVRD